MKKETITIYDVAREAGVSMATVSRVVNGNPNVKPTTREKVKEVIKRLNYRPNAVARGLASKKTTTVGVIIPDVTNQYYSSIARGIDDIATMYKYNIVLANSDGVEDKEVRVLQTLEAQQVDGIIFMGNNIGDRLAEEFSYSNTPIVIAGTVDPSSKMPTVNTDYLRSAAESVELLHQNGHDRIALVVNDKEDYLNGHERLQGYKEALDAAGLPFDSELVIASPYTYEAGEVLFEKLRDLEVKAAVVTNDLLAVSLVGAAVDSGVKIPEELEIISTDNSPLTQIVRPQLTTVGQPLYDIGAVAMRMLTKLMDEEELEDRLFELPCELEERYTTK